MKGLYRWTSVLLVFVLFLTSCASLPADSGAQTVAEALPAALEGLAVTAEVADAQGISAKTAFTITAPGGADLEQLKSHLSLSPETPFSLLAGTGENTFRLLPSETLQPDLIYRLELRTDGGKRARSWAFQTRQTFRVLNATPGAESYDVSAETGIEFQFNREDVDISRHFTIEPAVAGRFLTYGSRSAFAPEKRLEYGASYTVTLAADAAAPDGSTLGEAYNFRFTVEQENPEDNTIPLQLVIDSGAETFLPTDPPVMDVSLYNMKGTQSVGVNVYSLSAADYRQELIRRDGEESIYSYSESSVALFETEGLSPVVTFTRDIRPSTYEEAIWNKADDTIIGYRTVPNDYARGFLPFPQALAEGYYLAQVSAADPATGEDHVRQKLIQINNTAVYYEGVVGQSIIWLNDSAKGDAMAGATVNVTDTESGKALSSATTGADGSVIWENGIGETGAILQITPPAGIDYLDRVGGGGAVEPTADDLYIYTSFTDRSVYMPTDTIRYFGVVRGREAPLPAETPMKLVLNQGYTYSDGKDSEALLESRQVALAADGSFTADFSVEDLVSGYYTIQLWDKDEILLQEKSFQVYAYVKPEYVTSAWTDKEFYLPGESIDVNLKATYYDGTPVYGMQFRPNMSRFTDSIRPVRYYVPGEADDDALSSPDAEAPDWGETAPDNVATNAWGAIRVVAEPPAVSGWEPVMFSYDFYDADKGIHNKYGSTTYFPSDVILRAALDRTGASPVVNILANALDTSRLTPGSSIYYPNEPETYPENISGVPVETTVSVAVTKSIYHSEDDMKQLSVAYDWAAKKTLYTYDYNYGSWTEEQTVATYDITTTGGKYTLSDLPMAGEDEDNVNYYVTITGFDSRGTKLEQIINLSPHFWPYFGVDPVPEREERLTTHKTYSLVDKETFEDNEEYISSLSLVLGETAELALLENHEQFTPTGKYFSYTVGESIGTPTVSTSTALTATQRPEDVPMARISGAYFNDGHIYPVEDFYLHYKYDEQALIVDITADKERYSPGGDVALSAKVTDQTGKGVAARLCVSVVDEAVFATSDQNTDPLQDLYRNNRDYLYSGNNWRVSYKQHSNYYDKLLNEDSETTEEDSLESDDGSMNPSAGGGGGGEVPVRDEFLDTAQFLTLETDADGNATLDFSLPDNLTSWRITSIAVAGDALKAGHSITNVAATMEMFLNGLYNKRYLDGDEVSIAMGAQGVALDGSTPIRYHGEVTSQDSGKVVAKTDRKGRSDNATLLRFGALPQGEYTVTVTGTTNDQEDAVAYDIAVVSSNMELPVARRVQLTDKGLPLDIHPSRYPVLVGFGDERYGNYLEAAGRLVRDNSTRLDTMAAAVAGKAFMEAHLPEDDRGYLEDIPDSYGGMAISGYNTGGYALYAYDSADIELTAILLALCGTAIPGVENAGYMLEYSSDFHDPEEAASESSVDNGEVPDGMEADVDAPTDDVDVHVDDAPPADDADASDNPVTADEEEDMISPMSFTPLAVENPVAGVEGEESIDPNAPTVDDHTDIVSPDTEKEEALPPEAEDIDVPAEEPDIDMDTAAIEDIAPDSAEEPVADIAEDPMAEDVPANPGVDMPEQDEPVPNPYGDGESSGSSPDIKAAALMGRAAIGQPVLLELQKRLQEPELFTVAGQLYLVSGLALLGDQDTALAFYEESIAPLLTVNGDYKRLPGEGDDEGYRVTALALMASSLLGHADAEGLAAYLLNTYSGYYTPNLELAIYLQNFQPVATDPATFQYSKDGKTHKVTLTPGEVRYVQFMKEDLESGKTKLNSGNVAATVSYVSGAEDFALAYPDQENTDSPVAFNRDIRPTTPDDLTAFGRSDITVSDLDDGYYTVTLQVVFAPTAPMGWYELSERIPTSLRTDGRTVNDAEEGSGYYVYTDADQQDMTYSISRESRPSFEAAKQETVTFSYIAKQVLPGKIQTEPVLVRHGESGMTRLIAPTATEDIPAEETARTKRSYPVKSMSTAKPKMPAQADKEEENDE